MSTLMSVCFILVTGFYQFIDGNPVQLNAKVPISVYADLSETNLEEFINGKIDEEIEKQLYNVDTNTMYTPTSASVETTLMLTLTQRDQKQNATCNIVDKVTECAADFRGCLFILFEKRPEPQQGKEMHQL